jgi:predicted RNA-binding Zn-ribbon protein involved in translation (DUF1610 family)
VKVVRRVTTCLGCGWREQTRLEQSYALRCPNCGRSLEHRQHEFTDAEELRLVNRGPSSRRW